MNTETILIDHSLWNLLLRFFINLAVLYVLTVVIYNRFSKKEEYVFSFILMGMMIFLIASVLESIEVRMGTAMGLFAVFAILRFRTVQYTVKDITYVFMVIGVSVINSQSHIPPHIPGALIVNSIIILITYLLEIYLEKRSFSKFIIIYSKLELLKPGLNKELLKDLCRQTGQNIEKIIIQKIDIGRGNAEIEVYYKEKKVNTDH